MNGSSRFQQGSLIRVKNKRTADTWFLRYYEEKQGRRVYRNHKIGSTVEYPLRRDAERAALALRAHINSGCRTPETVAGVIAHYLKHELVQEKKASSTIEVNSNFLRLYIGPKWGSVRLSSIRTVAIEQWLSGLELAPASRTKIKAVFSAVFSHAIRYEWIRHNPVNAVRTSAKRLREKDVLTPAEFQGLLKHCQSGSVPWCCSPEALDCAVQNLLD